MLASLTLLPALLGFMGTKVLSRRQRAALEKTGPVAEAVTGGWRRWAEGIRRRRCFLQPWPRDSSSYSCCHCSASIWGSTTPGRTRPGAPPARPTTCWPGVRPGVQRPLRAGGGGPLAGRGTGLRRSGPPAVPPGRGGRRQRAGHQPRQQGGCRRALPHDELQSTATAALLARLRDTTIPKDEAGTGLTVLVGGATAVQTDFTHVLAAKLPLFVGVGSSWPSCC